jgi:predicted dehydrogenase
MTEQSPRDPWTARLPDYRPRFPTSSHAGIAVLGSGQIARTAHLPAYAKYGLDVVGVWSRTRSSAERAREQFPFVRAVYDNPEELLADPAVTVVDIATRVEHRRRWLEAAIAAGKHVLAQKPLGEDPEALVPVIERADAAGVRVAVNQNARWAPVWRMATLLIEQGAVGEVVAVSHILDKPLPPLVGTHFDDIAHMLVSDYLEHWTDVTRCWLSGKRLTSVLATDGRVPGQPDSAKNPWSATVLACCGDGATAMVRVPGDVRTRVPACPFWIHGSEATIRGSILGREFLELERGGVTQRFALEGAWFVDGFAGAMGELLCAIEEDREPYNSARNNLATLRFSRAATVSAEQGGAWYATDIAL